MRADGDHAPIGCTVSRRRIVGQADLVAIRIRSVLVLPVRLTHFFRVVTLASVVAISDPKSFAKRQVMRPRRRPNRQKFSVLADQCCLKVFDSLTNVRWCQPLVVSAWASLPSSDKGDGLPQKARTSSELDFVGRSDMPDTVVIRR